MFEPLLWRGLECNVAGAGLNLLLACGEWVEVWVTLYVCQGRVCLVEIDGVMGRKRRKKGEVASRDNILRE